MNTKREIKAGSIGGETSEPAAAKVIVLKTAAAGDIPNESIKTCYICKDNGWPHEAITFERVLGKVLSDGRTETKGWIIRDYFTGQVHSHRSNKQKECDF